MNKTFLSSSVFYGFQFMGGSVIATYLTLYYSSIHLSTGQIGLVTAIGSVVMLASQPFWGTVGDRAKSKNRILLILTVLCASTIWLLPLAGRNFALLIVANIIFNFFLNASGPMADTIVMELSHRDGFKFSTVRMIGSLGFALMSALSGQVLAASIFLVFPLFSGLRTLAAGAIFAIPKVEGHAHNKPQAARFMELFKDKKLLVLYAYALMLSITWNFFGSFWPVYAKETGVATGLIGIAMMIGSISQFPFMYVFDLVYKRFGIINLMLVSGLLYALRWLLFGVALGPASIMFLMAMHGMNFMVIYLCLTEYVGHYVPQALQTRGQMANSLTLFGISSVIGNLAGGKLGETFGLGSVFIGSAVLCACAVGFLFVASKLVWRGKFTMLDGRSSS